MAIKYKNFACTLGKFSAQVLAYLHNRPDPGGFPPLRFGFYLFCLALLAHLFLLPLFPLIWQSIAVLVLTGLLPGYLLIHLVLAKAESQPTWAERLLYTIGAGYSTMILAMLALSYLPGEITQRQALLWFDGWLLFLMLLWARQQRRQIRQERQTTPSVLWQAGGGWLVIGVGILVILGALYRFGNLGYAEFQGDEARLALRAGEVIQGFEGALFVHKKGPAEILLPTVIYVLTGHLTEATARLPFAIANFTAIFVMLLLGRRLAVADVGDGQVAGWVAALVITLDGYLIAFGRVVQYQSLVLLMTLLIVLILHRLQHQPRALAHYLGLAALFFVTGLFAHYEVLLAGIPALYLLWQIQRYVGWAALLRAALIPGAVSAFLLGSFYLPFAYYPEFEDTRAYLVGYRLGLGGLYNNLASFFQRTTLYSSTYYLLLLILVTFLALLRLYWRALAIPSRWLALFGAMGGLALTFYDASWLTLYGQDYTGLFFLGCMISAWLLAPTSTEQLIWLWFGGAMVVALFFTAIPNTHVYSFFIPWALLVGLASERAWQFLRRSTQQPLIHALVRSIVVAIILLFGFYEYLLFVHHDVEVLRTWPEHRPAGYWTAYDEPVEVAIFGFPLNNGWKAVAGLYARKLLVGPYATNARAEVAEWYTRGYGNCPRDEPNYYILVNPVEPTLADETAELRRQIRADHQLFGTVMVNGRPGLEIYAQTMSGMQPHSFQLQDYTAFFDKMLSTPTFERNGPVGEPDLQYTVDARFGEDIQLTGFHLVTQTATIDNPFTVTLYWTAMEPLPENYSVFVQLINLADLHKAGQRDGEPGCNAYPTTTWVPGTVIADRYDIPVQPDARPGSYTLLVGMVATDGTRLPVYRATGEPMGDALTLTTIDVTKPVP